mmetsp:Transcript_95400/g.169370  ORF Transcript_95400/g.169370 Transcript_95400/m.169370 type:complete len:110 (+) Transcript_95400:1843-2172(+)
MCLTKKRQKQQLILTLQVYSVSFQVQRRCCYVAEWPVVNASAEHSACGCLLYGLQGSTTVNRVKLLVHCLELKLWSLAGCAAWHVQQLVLPLATHLEEWLGNCSCCFWQ